MDLTTFMNNSNRKIAIRYRCQGHRRGFTVIELAVVVGIIGLVIGIVMPVLGNVRRSFRTVNCGDNQGRLATAMVSYGMDHAGWLVAGPLADFGDNDTQGALTNGLYYSSKQKPNLKNISHDQQWYGQGLLIGQGYVLEGSTFLCAEEVHVFDGQTRAVVPETKSAALAVEKHYFSSYAYRGGLLNKKRTAEGPLNLSRNGGSLAIFADHPFAFPPFDTAHGEGNGFNIAYLDTHVKYHEFNKTIVTGGYMPSLWTHKKINAFWD